MKRGQYRPRQRPLTEDQIAELWKRRAAGEAATRIARHMGRYRNSVGDYLLESGGIRPRPRTRSRIALTMQEREEISRGLATADSLRSIAVRIGRAPSTVSREVARNHGRQNYRAGIAEQAALNRGRRPKLAKLTICERLRVEVTARLKAKWSPQEIARFLKKVYPLEPEMQVAHETIYLSLYLQGRGLLRKELAKHLRRRHLIRQAGKKQLASGKGKIKDMIMISERPAEAADRAVPGHWEGDLLLGTPSTAIGTLVERSTRFVMLLHLPRMGGHGDQPRVKNGPALTGHGAEAVRDAIAASIITLPEQLRRSLTWDQGAEMAQHAQLRIDTGLQVYFCDPQSPWQRGSNENTNGLLRQYFPRGTDLARHTANDLDAVAHALNGRPRKTLGWKTPAEALDELLSSAEQAGVATTA